MPTPGFPEGTLDSEGTPIWITDLAVEDPNHTVHVVRGLEPMDALQLLGAKPRWIRPCELPAERPDSWTSLPRAVLGSTDSGASLLAGRIGAWTFVYDDAGYTSFDADSTPTATPAKSLSTDGRAAATSTVTINSDASLEYAVDGEVLAYINVDDLDLEADVQAMPAELRAAFDAAGIVEFDYLDEGDPDYSIGMRVLCALAGLQCTLDELRRIPLLVTPFG